MMGVLYAGGRGGGSRAKKGVLGTHSKIWRRLELSFANGTTGLNGTMATTRISINHRFGQPVEGFETLRMNLSGQESFR